MQSKQKGTTKKKVSKKLSIGLKRDTIDKYYTKQSVVDLCIEFVRQYINIDAKNDLIIEPSAGNGAFIPGIKSLSSKFLFFDLKPENIEILEQDYLVLDSINLKEITDCKKIHVIGNPPFGRQSSLAIKFIKKSSTFADSISFILPKSFKKDSLQKSFPLEFHLVFQFDLPKNSFLVESIEYDVPCVFQIWEKKVDMRLKQTILQPIYFKFVKQTEDADISVRRIGVNAGVISQNTIDKSVESHYFIKFTNSKSVEDNITRLLGIAYEFDNTVGPKSISKQELIYKFNALLSI
jgi:predicted RNA methylase